MKYSGYWPSIVETNPDNHVLLTFLSPFPSMSPITSPITPTNDGPVLTGFYYCHDINGPGISGPGGPFMFDINSPPGPFMLSQMVPRTTYVKT